LVTVVFNGIVVTVVSNGRVVTFETIVSFNGGLVALSSFMSTDGAVKLLKLTAYGEEVVLRELTCSSLVDEFVEVVVTA